MTATSGAPAAGPDDDFLAFADRSRSLLRGCAVLLSADPGRADRLTESVLARQATSRPAGDRLSLALAELVRPRAAYFDPPWSTEDRVQLRDDHGTTPDLLLELQRLAPEPRAALVLGPFAGLSAAQAAEILQTSPATLELWVRQAIAALAAGRPERLQPGRVADELRALVTDQLSGHRGSTGADDLAHGHQLQRRRRFRRLAALVAAAAVLVLGVAGVLRVGADAPAAVQPAASTPPTPSPSPSVEHPGTVTARCDIKNPTCQATVMREWRGAMAKVAADHLDPDGRYFTGYSFSFEPRYETPSFWKRGDGALGLEVFRQNRGATQVYLQIATSDDRAVRCGRTTRQGCVSQRFLDGNRFTLSESTALTDGVEVQYSPDGDQVITVVARNASRGQPLGVTRADLIELVQDPRLRLPVI